MTYTLDPIRVRATGEGLLPASVVGANANITLYDASVDISGASYPDEDAAERMAEADRAIDALVEQIMGDQARWSASRADSDAEIADYLREHPDGGAVDLPDPIE